MDMDAKLNRKVVGYCGRAASVLGAAADERESTRMGM